MIAIVLSTLVQVASLSGELPAQVDAAAVTRIVWVSGETGSTVPRSDCQLQLARGWVCGAQSSGDIGVVVIETTEVCGFVVFGRQGLITSGVAPWARMIRATVPGGADGEIVEMSAAALRISHPTARPNTRVLDVEPDADIRVWPIAPTTFWVAGTSRSSEAFIRLAAENVARHDEPLERIWGDAAEAPLDVLLQQPRSLRGRVESASRAVPGAFVDLFVRRPEDGDQGDRPILKTTPVIRMGSTRTDEEGMFAFDGLEPQLYKVAVVDFAWGRGEKWVDVAGAPLLITLEPPSKATGRVFRGKLPAPDVVVRFIPDSAAWRESTDPTAHLTLDTTTDERGNFVVSLPPAADGTLQLRAGDGATKRVPLRGSAKASDLALGDITLEEPIPVEVQTDAQGCVVSAVGPVGAGGFTIVRANSHGIAHALSLPEAGRWLMQVECAGVQRSVAPPSIDVSTKGELPIRNLHVE
jgi:hypothetical protein